MNVAAKQPVRFGKPHSFLLMTVATVATLLCLAGTARAAFVPLGDLPGGLFLSRASGVSPDGSVVVGESVSASDFEAFRWTPSEGMVGLGFLPGFPTSTARATSANGSVVVGTGLGPSKEEAVRWTAASGMVGLGFLSGFAESRAFDVSADGSVVVGNSNSVPAQRGQFEAFRWTAASGMVGLGFLSGGGLSSAEAVSADGSLVAGVSDSGAGRQAFRWTEAGGMIGLGDLPGGSFFSFAHGVSADGLVVVGISDSASGPEAFRWTQSGGMIGLGFLPGGMESEAFGASADGSVIVGRDFVGPEGHSEPRAFLWDTSEGMRNLTDVLIGQGDNLTGWKLIEALAVSSDGINIVGRGIDPAGREEAWLARIGSSVVPEPSTLALLTIGIATLSGLYRLRLNRR
jgi:probable HAF family extracellular repeat protein